MTRQIPRIKTKRLIVKMLEIGDAPAMYRYRSDPLVYRYQNWRPRNEEEVRTFIEDMQRRGFDAAGSWFQLGIYLQSSFGLIGDLGLHFLPPDSRQVEIGITIQPDQQRKGYATESLRAVIHHLFTGMGKHRVIGSVDPANTASIAMLGKMGMKKEAHFRESLWTPEGWADDLIFAVLEKDWMETDRRGSG